MSEPSKDSALRLELLAIRCQLGEPGAIDELVERWHSPLWRYVRRLIDDDSTAEEVHQDVWLRILRSIDRLRDPSRLAPWLFGIARRAVVDRLRQRYGDSVLVALDEEPLAASESHEIDFDENETLHETLEDLPWAEREVLTLFDLAMGVVIASLLITEKDLPLRTQMSFGVLLVIAIAWAVFFARTLSRTKLFLAGHRVDAARLAMIFTTLFTLGACILASAAPDVRAAALAAAGLGAGMLAVAVVLFVRANRRLRSLMSRKERLERQIGTRSDAVRIWPVVIMLAMLLPVGGAASAQMVSANPFEAVVPMDPVVSMADPSSRSRATGYSRRVQTEAGLPASARMEAMANST